MDAVAVPARVALTSAAARLVAEARDAEVAVVATYLTLCLEDHRWWWKAVAVPASFGLYMFVMSIVYFISIMPSTVTATLFISYSFMASVVLGVVAASIGLEVCLHFVVRIFSEVKVD